MNKDKENIFKNGSVTYYTASLFFPRKIKEDVFTLYAFVRVADNFVDTIPADKNGFLAFKDETLAHLKGKETTNTIIKEFVSLSKKKQFKSEWILSFLKSMEQDLTKKTYKTFGELEEYMYGSAEVIGLFMAAILELPKTSHVYAKKLGKAMQLINFIRDIKEDNNLGRTYLPLEDLKKFKITLLTDKNPDIQKLIRYELQRWATIQKEALEGLPFIPRTSRVCIKTASDMYTWTAKQIEKDPLVVFTKKLKPNKKQILVQYIRNMLSL